LGKYVPGKIWQLGAMATVLKMRSGNSVSATTAAATVITLVFTSTAFGLVALTPSWMLVVSGRDRRVSLMIVVVSAIGVAVARRSATLPLVVRETFQRIALPRFGELVLVSALIWILQAVGFVVFATGVRSSIQASPSIGVAFIWSYILGYIAFMAPGGIGVRETALLVALGRIQSIDGATALSLGIASRIWLTVLEVVPGLLLLSVQSLRGRAN